MKSMTDFGISFVHSQSIKKFASYNRFENKWAMETNFKSFKNVKDLFYVEFMYYDSDRDTSQNYYIHYKDDKYSSLLNRRGGFNTLVEAKIALINRFGQYVSDLQKEKDQVAFVKKIKDCNISFDYDLQNGRAWNKEHTDIINIPTKMSWYLNSDLPYMSGYLRNFHIQAEHKTYVELTNNVPNTNPQYSVRYMKRRSGNYGQIGNQSFHTLDEAKYHLIQKYFEFINYYKSKGYFES